MDRVQEAKVNKLVEEAPYHPGYEDAVIIKGISDDEFIKEDDMSLMIKMNERHLNTAKKIMEFMKGGQKWDR